MVVNDRWLLISSRRLLQRNRRLWRVGVCLKMGALSVRQLPFFYYARSDFDRNAWLRRASTEKKSQEPKHHRSRKRTPGPLPFASIKMMPADSRADFTARTLFGMPEAGPSLPSIRFSVGTEIREASANSFWPSPKRLRAAAICRPKSKK